MAKNSAVINNNKKAKMIARDKTKREELKEIIMNKETAPQDRMAAVVKLSELPRNGSKIRHRNRCRVTGRPRGFYRRFEASRIALRDLASSGLLTGVTKSSW